MFDQVENRLLAYADDSTLLAVVHMPSDRPAVAASLNRELARIQEWCNHWCMILNPSKTKALVVCRSRTVSHPHGDLALSGVCIRACSRLDILDVKFVSKFTLKDHMHGIISLVSQRIGILKLVKRVFVDSLCHFVAILHLFSKCLSIVLRCGGQLLSVTFNLLSARCIRRQGFVSIRVSCRCVIDVVLLGFICCSRLIRTLITVCSASFHLLLPEFDILGLLIHWSHPLTPLKSSIYSSSIGV